MKELKMKLVLLVLLFTINLNAQITNVSITLDGNIAGKDVFIQDGTGTTNYGSNSELKVFKEVNVPIINRSFIKFDLSAIPTNAIITEAKLKLTPVATPTGTFNYVLGRVVSDWEETGINGITWNNHQDSINSDEIIVNSPQSTMATVHEINVKDHVQNMVNFPIKNNGWLIKLENESLTGSDYGLSFWSSENSNTAYKPQIIISYALPIEITGIVSHCSTGNTDGSIDFTYTGGSGGEPVLFTLLKIEADPTENIGISTTQIYAVDGSSSLLNNQTIDASSLAPGLYKTLLKDSLYNSAQFDNRNKESLHDERSFLVGRHGEVTDVVLTWYREAMYVSEYVGGGGYYYSNDNYFDVVSSSHLKTGGAGTDTTVWNYDHNSPNNTHVESFFDSKIDFPVDLNFLKSDMHLRHHSTYQFHNSSNALYFTPCTQKWDHTLVTWNNKPNTDVSTQVYVPKTPLASGYANGVDTMNILPLVQYWQTHPNYGFEMKLASYNNPRTTYRTYTKFYKTNYGNIELSFTPNAVNVQVDDNVTTQVGPETNVVLTLNEDGNGRDATITNETNANLNFGSADNIKVHKGSEITPIISRGNLFFDLSAIPTNAILTSAELHLTPLSIDTVPNFGYTIERIDSIWQTPSINWNNQPGSDSTDQVIIDSTEASSLAVHEINVLSHAQKMVNYPYNNHGWQIKLNNEMATGSDYGITFHASNDPNGNYHPKLEITYVLPIEITSEVNHCTAGNDDGQVTLTVSGGSEIYNQYVIYKIEKDTTQLAFTSAVNISGYTMVNNTVIATGLAPGLYFLGIRDANWQEVVSYGKQYEQYAKHYFLVGRTGETTNCILSRWHYAKQVYIGKNLGALAADNDFENTNYNNNSKLSISGTGTDSYGSNNVWTYHFASLMDLQMDFPDDLKFSKSELNMLAWSRFNQHTTSSNETKLSPVTSEWDARIVTWNNRPTIDNSMQIILPKTAVENGNSIETRDVIDISPLIEYWKTNPNYGIEFGLSNYEYPKSADRSYKKFNNNSSFLELSFTPKPPVYPDYSEETGLGVIEVRPPSGNLPYTYLISKDPIIDLATIWNQIKDSIPLIDSIPLMDSISFFQGKTNAGQYVFENLTSDKYHVAVFDNIGTKILEDEVRISPEIVISNHSGLKSPALGVYADDPTVSGNGSGSLLTSLSKDESGGVVVTLKKLGGATFGFNYISDATATTVAEFIYGVDINNNGTYGIINNGVKTGTYPVSEGDEFKIGKEDNEFVLYQNDVEIERQDTPTPFGTDMKMDMLLEIGEIEYDVWGNTDGPRPNIDITYPNCGEIVGAINVSNHPTYQGFSLVSTALRKRDGNLILPNALGVYTNVPIGMYTLTSRWTVYHASTFVITPIGGNPPSSGYATTTSHQSTKEIVIGYVVNWQNVQNSQVLQNTLNTVTTLSSNQHVLNPGLAYSEYKTVPSQNNWIYYESQIHRPFESNSINKYQVMSLNFGINNAVQATPGNPIPAARVRLFHFYYGGVGQMLIDSYQTGAPSAYQSYSNPNGRFLIEQNSTGVHAYRIGLANALYSHTAGMALNLTPSNIQINQHAGPFFNKTITSFCGYDVPVQYVELNRKPQGGYYQVPVDDILKVEYNEEYIDADGALNYVIKNYKGEIMPSTIVNTTVDFGDNRKAFDVSTLPPDAFYTLEVSNDKNETFYLRFKIWQR